MFAFVLTAVQRVLIDPMPYNDPGDLYYVWRDYGPIADVTRGALGGPDIVELQKPSAVIQSAAGMRPMPGGIFSLREGSEPMEIAVAHTSPNLFDLLGVKFELGRGFTPEESGLGPGRERVIVLTHHLWNRLGANPGILGTDVRLQGRPHTVIGVTAAAMRQSMAIASRRGRSSGASAMSAFVPQLATSVPSTPPAKPSIPPSSRVERRMAAITAGSLLVYSARRRLRYGLRGPRYHPSWRLVRFAAAEGRAAGAVA